MKTALNLLNEIIGLGFDQQKALVRIDKIIDKKLGIEGRKPLSDEILPDEIYEDILHLFQVEAVEKLSHTKESSCNRNN
jgi:hypothetical protein